MAYDIDTIYVDMSESRADIERRLGELHKSSVNKVMKNGLKRAVKAYETAIIKETKKVYILKDKSIKDNMNIKADGDGFLFSTISRSRLVTHYDYGTVNAKTGRRKKKFKDNERKFYGTRVFKKNKLKHIVNSFLVSNKKHTSDGGKGILLQRPEGVTGKKARKPKNWLVLGPAIATIVKNEEVQSVAKSRAMEILEKRIDHEIERILQNGG